MAPENAAALLGGLTAPGLPWVFFGLLAIVVFAIYLAIRASRHQGRAEVLAEITEEERRKADDYATIMADRRTADDVARRMSGDDRPF